MSGYLRKYVGKYRVKAEYDMSTNDWPRLSDGTLDSSFDDYYIDCSNNIKRNDFMEYFGGDWIYTHCFIYEYKISEEKSIAE